MAKAMGTEVGTTNSVITVMEGGNPMVIGNRGGGRPAASAVVFTAGGGASAADHQSAQDDMINGEFKPSY